MRASQFKPFQFGAGFVPGFTNKVRAAELLKFIEAYIAEHGGVAPSFTEMAASISVPSKSQVHRVLAHLERDGKIRRLPDRARALEVVKREAYFVWDDEAKELVPFKPPNRL